MVRKRIAWLLVLALVLQCPLIQVWAGDTSFFSTRETTAEETTPEETEPSRTGGGGFFTRTETTPAETEPAETTPAETEPSRTGGGGFFSRTETTPAETEPAETTPAETEPVETMPAETTPAETTPAETEPSRSGFWGFFTQTETTPAETDPAETMPVETEPAETEPVETTPAETEPVTDPEPAVPFIVNACLSSEPDTVDPSLISYVDASVYTQHQFENLMKYQVSSIPVGEDEDLNYVELVPGQAESYEVSEDGLVYTFTLRDDIYWSDGQPVTAADFVYSWQRLVDPYTDSPYCFILDGIVLNAEEIEYGEMDKSNLGIHAVDDKTLEIVLEAPCAYFLELCAFGPLVPLREDVVETGYNWTEPENIVVNGPYITTEWAHGNFIRMEQNPYYYDGESLGPDAIVWWLSDDPYDSVSDYQAGEYQFTEVFPGEDIESLQESGDCFINPNAGVYYLYLNCERIPDWRVRAAMTLCLEREYITDYVLMAGQTPAGGFVASGIQDSTGAEFYEGFGGYGAICSALQKMYPDADLTTYEGRCELALMLYDEAVADGAWDPDTELVYKTSYSNVNSEIAESCAYDWWNVLGLNVFRDDNLDWASYTENLRNHDFDLGRLGWIADFNDPVTFLELMRTGTYYNYGSYSNETFDNLVRQAQATPAGEERDALLYQAEETLFGVDGFPICPIYYYTLAYCMKDITNVGYSGMGYFIFSYAKQK